VLLRPRNADNLGAIARAMKNFGLTDWVAVAPNPQLFADGAGERLAVQAGDLLASLRCVDSLAAAVGDCSWVVGTTMRRVAGQRRLTPRELTTTAQARDERVWALVFGDERVGMTNADLAQCHAVSFIPAPTEQPSLNLAQAVVIYGYELAMARRGDVAGTAPAWANDAQLRDLRSALEAGLTARGFLAGGAVRQASTDLMATLVRSRLTDAEAELWVAAWRTVARAT
jgi:TrmH family RNA methyltransferase